MIIASNKPLYLLPYKIILTISIAISITKGRNHYIILHCTNYTKGEIIFYIFGNFVILTVSYFVFKFRFRSASVPCNTDNLCISYFFALSLFYFQHKIYPLDGFQ